MRVVCWCPAVSVRVEPADRAAGLRTAGVGEVIVDDLAVDDGRVFTGDRDTGLIAGAGAAAAVVGSADGVWRKHVDQVRARLDVSYGGDEVTDEAAAEVARAASDIDAAKLQITGSLDPARRAPRQGLRPIRRPCARRRGPIARKQQACVGRVGSGDRPLAGRPRRLPAGRPDPRRASVSGLIMLSNNGSRHRTATDDD